MPRQYIKHILVTLFTAFCIMTVKAQDTLSPARFQYAIDHTPNAVLIDVRTPKEYGTGHLKNARNIDWKDKGFFQQVDTIDHNTAIYLYCLGGTRSNAAANQMKAQGFTHIKQLSGGILAWQNDKLPIDKANSETTDAYTKADLQKVLQVHPRVLVDFNAPWCGPCLVMAPRIKKLEKEFSGKLYIERINVDNAKNLAESMNIRSIPILILFENGQPIKALEGNQSLKAIRAFLQ